MHDQLLDPAFLKSVLRTQAEDRRSARVAADGSQGGGRANWSVGVGELIGMGRHYMSTWLKTRFRGESKDFSSSKARFWEFMGDALSVAFVRAIAPVVSEALQDENSRDRQLFRCAAAEVVGGLLRSATRPWGGDNSRGGSPAAGDDASAHGSNDGSAVSEASLLDEEGGGLVHGGRLGDGLPASSAADA